MKITREILLVAVGGVVGSSLRTLASELPLHSYQSLLIVNLVGTFALGLLLSLSVQRNARLFLGTGLLGGFTTTSALATTALSELQGSTTLSLFYVALTFYGGLLVFRFAGKLIHHA